MQPAPQILLFGSNSTASGGGSSDFSALLLSLGPSGYWKFDEAAGSTTFADSSGNNLTATGAGILVPGALPIFPGGGNRRSVNWAALGRAALASAATFDYTSLQAISVVCNFTMPNSTPTCFLYSKGVGPVAGEPGHHLLTFGGVLEFFVQTDAVNRRGWTVPAPTAAGAHFLVLSWDGNPAHSPNVWIDGVAQTVTATAIDGTPANISSARFFTIAGRSDGLNWNGLMQDFAFFSGKALTAQNAADLWALNQVANRGVAIPYIFDSDGGSSDKGDLSALANVIQMHRIGIINLIACIVTCGDDFTAPATRAILDYYGLTSIPVGAYQGTDCHVDGTAGRPSRLIRDAFRPADVRANYPDPATVYNSALSGQSNGSVVVAWGGFANSIAQFLNASGANRTLWNAKLKLVMCIAGQWPNSSDAASPAGNFAAAGGGEWNIGGSNASSAIGIAEAQAANDLVTFTTTPPIYWHGVEICGNTGTSPALGNFISSDIPSVWSTSNPVRLGWGTGARTAWDILGTIVAADWARNGITSSIYWSRTQITAPTISIVSATAGQNASSAGSTNNYYMTPKLGSLTLTQWRTMMAIVGDASIPAFA